VEKGSTFEFNIVLRDIREYRPEEVSFDQSSLSKTDASIDPINIT